MSQFAKIRAKLEHIKHRNKKRTTLVVQRPPGDLSMTHLPITHIPQTFLQDNWVRELRCRLLPWLVWKTPKTETWLVTQMACLAWKRRSRLASPSTSQIYFIYETEAASEWKNLEIQCAMDGTHITAQQIILHQNNDE